MTRIAADQLVTNLSQTIYVYRDMSLAGLRVKLYFHNLPDGTFYLNIYKGAEKIKSFPFDSLVAKQKIDTPYSYFWIDMALASNFNLPQGEYSLVLESWGYTFSGESFLGWVKDFDPFGDVIGEPSDFSEYPFNYRLIEYVDRELAL
jgi:hypothetical protein